MTKSLLVPWYFQILIGSPTQVLRHLVHRRLAGATIEWPVLASAQFSSLLLTLVAAVLLFRLNASLLVTLGVTGLLGMLASFF